MTDWFVRSGDFDISVFKGYAVWEFGTESKPRFFASKEEALANRYMNESLWFWCVNPEQPNDSLRLYDAEVAQW